MLSGSALKKLNSSVTLFHIKQIIVQAQRRVRASHLSERQLGSP